MVTRVAILDIVPSHLEQYKAAVREEIQTSVSKDAGVLGIFAVAEKDNPNRIRFFEMYASDDAYKAHISSPEFKKYQVATHGMIKSIKLIETLPVQLSRKPD